jgi:hypothetical protein
MSAPATNQLETVAHCFGPVNAETTATLRFGLCIGNATRVGSLSHVRNSKGGITILFTGTKIAPSKVSNSPSSTTLYWEPLSIELNTSFEKQKREVRLCLLKLIDKKPVDP